MIESIYIPSVDCPGPEDEESFHLEMRSFLLELACPHSSLTKGLQTTSTPSNRILLLGMLATDSQKALNNVALLLATEEREEEREGRREAPIMQISQFMVQLLKEYVHYVE